MVFIAHVNEYDDIENTPKTEKIILIADGFVDATEKLVSYYGSNLESISLLDPISDKELIHIDTIVEDRIRNNSLNDFF